MVCDRLNLTSSKLVGKTSVRSEIFVAPTATNPQAPSRLHSRLRCATTRQAISARQAGGPALGLKVRNMIARAEGPGTITQNLSRPVRPKFAPEFWQCPDLECAGMTALWNWQTCLPVRKRRHVAALQKRTLHEVWRTGLFRPFRTCGFCHSDPRRCPGLLHHWLSALSSESQHCSSRSLVSDWASFYKLIAPLALQFHASQQEP